MGACIESHTEVCGGVFVRRPFKLAVGVAERLGYTVLVRESGRGGISTLEVIAIVLASDSGYDGKSTAAEAFLDREALACARRASSIAAWSRNLFSRS
jgi:hypothetical protein